MDEDMGHRLEESKKERDAHWEAVLQKKYIGSNIIYMSFCVYR